MGKTPVELGVPIRSASIDLTEGCSLACKYCFADLLSKKKSEKWKLTEDVMKAAIDWLFADSTSGTAEEVNAEGGIRIEFWGGEPLHNWDMLVKMTEYIESKSKETGKRIGELSGTTNVVEIDKEKLEFFKEHNINFLMSIDGVKEAHDMFRIFPSGKGSWDVINEKLDMILDYFPYWQARISLHPAHVKYLYESFEYFISKGIYNAFYSPVYEADWTPEVWEEYEKQVKKIIKRMIRELKMGRRIEVKFINDMINYIIQAERLGIDLDNMNDDPELAVKLSERNQVPQPCGAGYRYVGISVDGQIYVCHRFNKHNMHHIPPEQKFGWLGNVWDGIINTELWERFHNWNVDDIPHCKGCPVRYHCKGGCYASNYDNAGAIGAKLDTQCQFQLTNYKLAKYALEEFKKAGLYDEKEKSLIYPNPFGQSKPVYVAEKCFCYNSLYTVPDYLKGEDADTLEETVLGMAHQVISKVIADLAELKTQNERNSKDPLKDFNRVSAT